MMFTEVSDVCGNASIATQVTRGGERVGGERRREARGDVMRASDCRVVGGLMEMGCGWGSGTGGSRYRAQRCMYWCCVGYLETGIRVS